MQIARDESGQVLKLAGVLEIAMAEELHTALRDFIYEAAGPVIDLSEVEACDTAALQLLCSARKTAEGAGKPFALRGVPAAIEGAGAAHGLRFTEWPVADRGSAPAGSPDAGSEKRGDEDAVQPD